MDSPAATAVPGFGQLENEHGVRLGVWAWDTGTNRSVTWRSGERFAYVSTFKALACAALLRRDPMDKLDDVVSFTSSELVTYSPVTEKRVDTGMTTLEICDAAIRYSDNTAGNLLLKQLGGPDGFTASLKGIGDETTLSARVEPDLNTAVPGDVRDTSTPEALGTDLMKYAVGESLTSDKRSLLQNWLQNNTTGANLIRAGVPADWQVGDKTGAGGYGTRNDIAVLWPPDQAPIVIAIMSTHHAQDAQPNDAVVAEATRLVCAEMA